VRMGSSTQADIRMLPTMKPQTVLGVDAAWTASEGSGVALFRKQETGEWSCCALAPSYSSFLGLADGHPVPWDAAGRFSDAGVDLNTLLPAADKIAGAARRGYRVLFATAQEWVARLADAKRQGRLDAELERLRRIPLLVVDEVGYIPFDSEAAALFFALISSRYERSSLIVSSNKTFSSWAETFGDPVAVVALVDRLVHHAEVVALRGKSYRLKGKGKEVLEGETTEG